MAAPSTFRGIVRFFRPDRAAGLAVVDLPDAVTKTLSGLKQIRVRGTLNGTTFTSNVMPAGKGVLALSVSRALLVASGLSVGDQADVEIEKDAGAAQS